MKKKLNFKSYSLIDEDSGDYFSSDIVNYDVIEDGTNPTVEELSEFQAKQSLCIALRTIRNLNRKIARIRTLTY